MGRLVIPAHGNVYIDTSILIYTIEEIQPYYDILLPLWEASASGNIEIISSELIILETLTGPIKTGNTQLINDYEEMLFNSDVTLIPITQAILTESARLRAKFNIKTPDAIHGASSISSASTLFLTNDYEFRKLSGLPVIILQDIISAPLL